MTDCCKNCRYCRACKQLENGKWERFRICMLLADDADGFALVVHDNDICECFEKNMWEKFDTETCTTREPLH